MRHNTPHLDCIHKYSKRERKMNLFTKLFILSINLFSPKQLSHTIQMCGCISLRPMLRSLQCRNRLGDPNWNHHLKTMTNQKWIADRTGIQLLFQITQSVNTTKSPNCIDKISLCVYNNICSPNSEHIAELCNGSTYDSDSYCLGSNPSSAANMPPWSSG